MPFQLSAARRFGFKLLALTAASCCPALALAAQAPGNADQSAGNDAEPAAQAAAKRVEYERDIQPLLAKRCYGCHGPQKQEGQLRLDARAVVLRGGVSGPLLRPGNAKGSLLVERITAKDEDERMPPEGAALSPVEVQLLRRWIDEGARWPAGVGAQISTAAKHWAYQRPVRPIPPKVKQRDWPAVPIDFFVLSRLEQEGIEPAPPAPRATLLRRVYLDLVGLPPTDAQLTAFLADTRPDAYRRTVESLLASKRYGERWARPWLDAARYADSNGYQADQYREVWAYRDWVIRAFNDDMPFDQFTLEQLAGDLLPNATVDQKVATGFHRCTTCNVEAGVDPEENRVNQIFDRINTTGTVWLGTSLECAQCHNHKYDPFTQQDYYQLFAFLNNTPLEVQHTQKTTYDFYGPKLALPSPQHVAERRESISKQLAAARSRLKTRRAALKAEQSAWEKALARSHGKESDDGASPTWHVLAPVSFQSIGGASHQILDDGSVLLGGKKPEVDTYTLEVTTDLAEIRGFQLETLTHSSLPGMGPGRHHPERPNFVLQELTVAAIEGDQPRPVRLTGGEASHSNSTYPVTAAIDGDPKTGWAIHAEFHKPHRATFGTVQPCGGKGTRLRFQLAQNHGEGRLIGRLRIRATSDRLPVRDVPAEIARLAAKPNRSKAEQAKLNAHFLDQQADVKALAAQIAKLEKQQAAIKDTTTLVMVEMEKSRMTHVFKRGDFLSPTSQVRPDAPRVLHRFPDGAPRNRVGLAKWLVSAENPLVARVTVNRWWAEIFGNGIVASVEDFGTQGDRPSHPELLDWLAVEFVESGWSMKHIHKLIVMSSTYQQSSRYRAELANRDPYNRLLARGARIRLSAEAIRDNALTICGLLSDKQGGPPIYPPQPAGVWRHVGRNAPKYATSTGPDRFRRGIYVVWRRSAPYASFVNFDAPDRAACVVKRSRTNTPLQALTLLNDPAYIEMAQALARRILAAGPQLTLDQRVDYAFRLAVARAPQAPEREHLREVYRRELARLQNDLGTARQLAGKDVPAGANVVELAAWFYLANILLNLDETITKS